MNTTSKFLFLLVLICLSFSIHAEEYGIASYYADDFQGRKTASEEPYDKDKLTGAHKTLPFGTIVKVTRLDSKKSVRVRINDRGPFIKGRVIEVSKKAAEVLGLIDVGTAEVRVEVVGKGVVEQPEVTPPVAENRPKENTSPPSDYTKESTDPPAKLNEDIKKAAEAIAEKTEATQTEEPKANTTKEEIVEGPEEIVITPKPSLEKEDKRINRSKEEFSARLVKGSNYQTYDLYKIQLLRPKKEGYGVQVASLTQYEFVLKKVAELQEKFFKNVLISVEKGSSAPVYKIILGPFPDLSTASSYKRSIAKRYKMKGFVVSLQ